MHNSKFTIHNAVEISLDQTNFFNKFFISNTIASFYKKVFRNFKNKLILNFSAYAEKCPQL